MHEPTGSSVVVRGDSSSMPSSAATPRPAARGGIVRRAARAGLIGLTSVSLLGCTTTYREFVAFQEGWRAAEVLEVGVANALQRRGITDCRQSATADELQTRRFATVGYRMAGRQHVHIVLLNADSSVRSGDRVFLNVLQCGSAVVLRNPSQVPDAASRSMN